MLAVGYLYVVAGLVIPQGPLYAMWTLWALLAALQVKSRRRSIVVLALPLVAFCILILVTLAGDFFWGWTA